jgi:hypothetical protein
LGRQVEISLALYSLTVNALKNSPVEYWKG